MLELITVCMIYFSAGIPPGIIERKVEIHMKKIISLLLALALSCMLIPALGESEDTAGDSAKLEPMYATLGDALDAAGDNRVAGGEEDYYAVVTEKDGKYYRSVAYTDDRSKELQQAVLDADFDQIEETNNALDEYIRTLPIAYSEEFTAPRMEQAEMDALVGKTIGELREAGYEDRESGTEGDDIVYVMANGIYAYACVVDADFDAYEQAQEDWENGGKNFVVTSVSFYGVSSEACYLYMHADGTVDEIPDPFAGYNDLAAEVLEAINKVRNGENVDTDSFFSEMKEKYPELADTVDMYVELYKALGADDLAAMLTPAE